MYQIKKFPSIFYEQHNNHCTFHCKHLSKRYIFQTRFGRKMSSIFGPKFEEMWPKVDGDTMLKLSNFGKNLLKKCLNVQKPDASEINVQNLMQKSTKFPLDFGTNTCRVISQPPDRHPIISQQIKTAYPIIHEHVIGLYLAFLEHKCKFGNEKEQGVFKNLTLTDFVQRLLINRCAAFFGRNDKYKLISGEEGFSGFEKIGTMEEKQPLILQNVLSYDEIKLSALLSVSSMSEFLNNGNRQNRGVIETNKNLIEREGIVIGIIGARLTRLKLMEYQDIVINKNQNTKENGYGEPLDAEAVTRDKDYRRIWKQFYEEPDYLFESVTKDHQRFGDSKNKYDIFDNVIMKKRYAISFDTLLLESENRAVAAGKRAYIHVVGIGLGVWKVAEQQEKIFLETFSQRLQALLPKLLHIDVVHFSWFHLQEWGNLKHNGTIKSESHPNGGIKILISKRNPADKLQLPEFMNMLLVVSYAWDGNALPGNEFWMKYLASTGDSSTACSTLITELHNPHINSKMVCGANLHIASPKYGLLHILDYAKKICPS